MNHRSELKRLCQDILKGGKSEDTDGDRIEHNGKLPAWAWPGGYPILYLTEDNSVLCPQCANGENGSVAFTHPSDGSNEDKQWHIVAADINYEDDSCYCEHCNARIESAYGDKE